MRWFGTTIGFVLKNFGNEVALAYHFAASTLDKVVLGIPVPAIVVAAQYVTGMAQ